MFHFNLHFSIWLIKRRGYLVRSDIFPGDNSTAFLPPIQNNNIIASKIAYFKFHRQCDRFLEQETVRLKANDRCIKYDVISRLF